MATHSLTGIFESAERAIAARQGLLDAGIDASRITLSVPVEADGLAAEAPGQSYENQPGQPERENAEARYNEAIRAGGCALFVECDSARERQGLEALLRARGARQVTSPPR